MARVEFATIDTSRTTARAALRRELGRRLGIDPATVALTAGPHGKPALAPPHDASGLTFNVAHAGDLALLAFAERVPVGCDIERPRDLRHAAAIAARLFGPGEAAKLATLEGDAFRREFFRLWTRHEAVVKCLGGTILAPPHLLERGSLAIAEIAVPEGYLGAVCVADSRVEAVERPLYSAG